ncbi:TPA: pyridoxal phosphate-dependent aminotransferase [Vibrio vulnificus]|uniref:cysteine-S-conjugate beta-lyase n=2 Tax=Vibrio vulnificus TaxID=672 RepID=A0A3Q0KZM2_VIBVU|nr:MalY/PatB family protein [Vibrio vulnificus]AAO07969.1 Aspartate aminotransferase [Vibrio vulnificus CMCP6]AXX62799.1 Aspartate aminotransferase [Vibrio vulnificus]MCU8344686.1 pyridoxal phosphate-dependent aminotransferase [Vibrio vulnificus]QBN16044.1 pyridoxal phosphate-dependent aminotransferase [Vibrio vulnificus]WHE24332.1 pyridoxal phosphate-dependent aminotransferase [Vibrio vulnificus]
MNAFDQILNRKESGSLKWDFIQQKLGLTGTDLLPMWVSDYDFKAPQVVLDALQQRVEHGIFGYAERDDAYYQATIDWYRNQHDTCVEREWITTVHGVLPGLAMALQMLTETGDGIVMQSPGYGSFRKIIEFNDRVVVENPLTETEGDYQLDFDHLETCFANGAKAMIFCNPHNPTGRVWSESEITKVAELCEQYQVWLLSDEIWGDLVVGDAPYYSALRLPQALTQRLIVATAASKTFGLSSLRISNFMIPDESLRAQFTRRLDAHGMDVFNSLSMSAATIAYQECSDWLVDLKDYLRANIAKLERFVQTELPEVKFVAPQAGYLAWLDCRVLNLTDTEIEQKFVSAGLVPSMGIAFGKEGAGFVRLNLGCPVGTLDQALIRIKQALS